MEQGAGAVVDTDPLPGIEDVANHDIVIYANPDPMPVMAPDEIALGDILATQNSTITDDNKKTIARECLRDVRAAGRPDHDCSSLPIFVVGREARGPAQNDLAGITRNPSWVALNARDTTDVLRDPWYFDRATPEPGCLQAEKFPATAQCDEYPFFSTLQAYGGSLNTMVPSIRWTSQRENGFEGNALKQFYSTNAPGPTMRFPGCAISKQAPNDLVPEPASTFLVIPVPYYASTTSVCNKPAP